MGIDGLFAVPLGFTLEKYTLSEKTPESVQDIGSMKDTLMSLLRESIRGEISDVVFTAEKREGFIYVNMFASCSEEIGKRTEIGETEK